MLLDLLKAIQLAQTNITGSLNQLGSRANHVMFKRALGDEFETLVCLKICSKCEDGAFKLVQHPSGLFTVAVCVMSNYSKSRILSLQLLARLCDMDPPAGGHRQVSDAISMLRLRFGEPVRFKFLVGMLNSYNSAVFQIACLRFLNRFVETSKDVKEKIMVQSELEEAGFDLAPLKKIVAQSASHAHQQQRDLLKDELDRWNQNYVDVNALVKKLLEAERANKKLREEIAMLREKQRVFEQDRKQSMSTVDRLKQCCDHLQSEIDKREGTTRANKNQTTETTQKTTQTEKSELRNQLVEVDDEDVLILLPSNISEQDLHLKPKMLSEKVILSSDDVASSMVTVLASDGYTCITSPIAKMTTAAADIKAKAMVGCSGDSGLSSDSSEQAAGSPANNRAVLLSSSSSSSAEGEREKGKTS